MRLTPWLTIPACTPRRRRPAAWPASGRVLPRQGCGPALTTVLVQGPAHGSLTLNGTGSFLYTPDADFAGEDTFVYQASDGLVLGNTATITLYVNDTTPSWLAYWPNYGALAGTPLTIGAD